MAERDETNYIRVMTPPFRLSFPHIIAPQPPIDGNGKPKYGIKMLFPKDPAQIPEAIRAGLKGQPLDLSEIKKVCAQVANTFWPKGLPANLKKPIHDGDSESDYPEDAGFFYASARSNTKPGVVDGNVNAIKGDEALTEKMYAGCWCRARIQIGAGDKAGSKYVHFALCNIQRLGDAEKFGNRKDAKQDFDAVDGYVDENASEAPSDFSASTF